LRWNDFAAGFVGFQELSVSAARTPPKPAMDNQAERYPMIDSQKFRNLLAIPAALLLGATVVAGASVAIDAWAQDAQPGAQAPAAAAQQDFTDQDLKSYASAVVKVQDISTKFKDKMRTTNDTTSSTDIQKQAEAEAVAAVKQEGLTVEKYNKIALAAETDPEVRSKVLDYVAKAK
jgi:hypothetical protein